MNAFRSSAAPPRPGGRPALRGRGPSHGKSGHAPDRAHTNRRDQEDPSARRTPSERDGFRPRSAVTSYWSHARPGTFISARRRRRVGRRTSSTRQKSSASPTRRWSGSRRPRRIPTPPTRRSTRPLILQSTFAYGQPASPPRRSTSAKTRSGGAATIRPRRSMIIPSREVSDEQARPVRPGERVEPGGLDVVRVGYDRSPARAPRHRKVGGGRTRRPGRDPGRRPRCEGPR